MDRQLTGRAMVTIALMLTAQPASAQCGGPISSCRRCHEAERQNSPRSNEDWHRDHAFADLCVACHGGDANANDQALAHAALVNPTLDSAQRCESCHTDAATLRSRYLATLSPPSSAAPPPSAGDTERHEGSSESSSSEIASIVALMVLTLGGGCYVISNEKRLRQRRSRVPA